MKNKDISGENNEIKEQSKRQFLRGIAAAMGATAVSQFVSANALAVAFSYEANESSQLKAGKLFSQPQMMMLHDICDVVLPKTDTPSAAELDVHGFLDHQIFTCYGADIHQLGLSTVEKIEKQSLKHFDKPFVALSRAEQTQFLVDLEAGKLGFNQQDIEQFKGLKSLIVFGFFTTEVGATQALNYQAVPGGFKGSVPYSSLKKSWGSLGFY